MGRALLREGPSDPNDPLKANLLNRKRDLVATECDHGSGWVMTNTDSLSRSLLLESLKRSHNKKLKIKLFKE